MTWSEIRAHFAAVHAQAGTTQQAIADRGGIAGQNTVSRLLANDKLGPSVEIFIRALEGLGKPASEFFAELERARTLVAEVAIEASMLSRLQRLEAEIEVISRAVSGAQVPPGSREGRASHGDSSISHGIVNHIHVATFDPHQFEALVRETAEGVVARHARLEAEASGAPAEEGDGRVLEKQPAARVDRRRAAEHV